MLESAADRLEFFDKADFAVDCLLVGPDSYNKTIPVIFNPMSDPVTVYDSNIEAPHVSFLCLAEHISDLPRRQIRNITATIGAVTYQIERLTDDQDGYLITVYLKK